MTLRRWHTCGSVKLEESEYMEVLEQRSSSGHRGTVLGIRSNV